MKIKKYRAADSQQAMRLIRAEQGPDASILTCYQVPEGVEFVVALDVPDLQDADHAVAATGPARRQKIDGAGGDRDMLTLRQELGSMRTLLERHLHRLAVREPQPVAEASALGRQLDEMEVSGALQQRLRMLLPEAADRVAAADALRASLADLSCGEWPVQGVSALVGPSGAGKSQLLATLALRHVLAGNRQPLYLVSCDQQRFGAREQLLALGRVLRLPTLFVSGADALVEALAALPADARVLLDTAGVDHGDSAGMTALAGLLDAAGISHRVLVMPLDMAEATRRDTLAASAPLRPSGLVTTRADVVSAGVQASWLCRAGLHWLGTSAGRDPASAWREADIDGLTDGLLAAWPVSAAELAPAEVSRWSWTSQRIPA